MANIINLDRVGKGYGAAGQLLTDVSLGLDDDARVGIVGLNGAGKSTLLRMLAKTEEPDSGRVTHRRDLRVASLPQNLTLDGDATVRDVVLGTAWLAQGMGAEHEWAGDAGVRAILDGLGMGYLGLDTPVGPMSGGERRRVALAALLVRDSDLLILDEPTNHLDVAGVDWLARYLLTHKGALVVVTHDRWFLDAVCTATWEVVDEQVQTYEGGYAAWTLARAERQRIAASVEARRQNLLRKEIAWLRRGPPARTSKPQFRIDAANALIADVPEIRDKVALQSLAVTRLGKQVVDILDASVSYGEREVLQDVEWRIAPGERTGILGVNGAGKSTLLGLIDGTVEPTSGRVKHGKTVQIAALTQGVEKLAEHLDEPVRVVLSRLATTYSFGSGSKAQELTPSQLLERLGFASAQLSTPVKDLSGGQQRRLQLLLILLEQPNVLILDEPTNDLDTDMLAAMEDLLDSWPGTLIVVSHDRYFLERVTDQQFGILGGRLRHLPGGVDEYLRLRASHAAQTGAAADKPAAPVAEGLSGAELRVAQKELTAIERRLEKLAGQIDTAHQRLAEHDQGDYEGLQRLTASLRALEAQVTELEERWMELSEEVSS